jgi:diacylglycerol kinase
MIKKRITAFRVAFEGIMAAFKKELHLKIHALATLLVMICSIYFKVSKYEFLLLVLCCGTVISLELINCAVERLTDERFKEQHPSAKYIKDVAAGAVLIAALTSAVIGVLIFYPYIFK